MPGDRRGFNREPVARHGWPHRWPKEMIYARIEAYPTKGSPEEERYGGALVNCWINRHDLDEAVC